MREGSQVFIAGVLGNPDYGGASPRGVTPPAYQSACAWVGVVRQKFLERSGPGCRNMSGRLILANLNLANFLFKGDANP
jgi:hypothetical protein